VKRSATPAEVPAGVRDGGSIQVLNKAVALLELLADRGEMGAADLAAATDEPRSSVYRLLASLADLGLVDPGVQRGTYKLGLGLFRLGSAVVGQFDVRRAAVPAMEELHRDTGQTIFLSIRRGNEAVCIERLDGRDVQSMALRLGGSLPLHMGATPIVLLAYQPQAFIDEYLARADLKAGVAGAARGKTALAAELKQIRSEGFAISDEDVTPGIAAIGAPVFGMDGSVQAAVSISSTRPLILGDRDTMIAKVVDTANRISRALGYDEAQAGGRDRARGAS
jgi:DNA-binding IclR family transcriptional regulator